jgi:hypothetical protein
MIRNDCYMIVQDMEEKISMHSESVGWILMKDLNS